MTVVTWLHRLAPADVDAWRDHARASVLDVNDGIVTAAGIAEGFASAGASRSVVFFAGAAIVLAGCLAAAAARYTEEQTEHERNRTLLEEERASIEADPDAELEELVGLYQAKGLPADLARQVAETLTEHDPVAAHADAELRIESIGSLRDSLTAAVTAGLSFAAGAALPLAAMYWFPSQRIEVAFVVVLCALALTGWLSALLTGLPVLRLVRRNVILGAGTMLAGLLIGTFIDY
jgi:VIT1/CCC1 family predicted Fe2+/Mn2+ transporter